MGWDKKLSQLMVRETNKNIETLLFGNDEISINEILISSIKFEHILDTQKDYNQWSVIWSTSTSIYFPCIVIYTFGL
jgi:hypothetical protein